MAKRKKKKGKKPAQTAGGRLLTVLRSFVFGDEIEEDSADRLQEIKGLVLIGLALWILVSLGSYFRPWDDPRAAGQNWGGQAGYYLASWVFMGLGWAGYLLTFLALAWGCILVARKRVDWPTLRLFGGLCFLISSAFLLELSFGETHRPGNQLPYGPGGWLALQWVGENPFDLDQTPILVEKFGGPGLWILLIVTALVSFMLATEMAFLPAIVAFRDWREEKRASGEEGLGTAILHWAGGVAAGLWDFLRGRDLVDDEEAPAKRPSKAKAKPKAKAKKAKAKPVLEELEDEEEEDEYEYEDEEGEYEDEYDEEEEEPEEDEYEYVYEDEDEEEDDEEEWEDEEEEEPELEVKPAKPKTKAKPSKKSVSVTAQPQLAFDPPTPPPGPWKFPPVDILEPPGKASADGERSIELSARKLENALQSFRVEANVVGAKVGPAVTMFELEVSQGTRMNKVTQLSQEIAAALRAKSVRIIAPIPGRSTVGIEVPNTNRRVVRLAELISQKAYDKGFAALPLFLGMDAEGDAIVADMARMPHLLIAGTTGSGKSVCINCILASLLLTRSPHDVQLILVDPKMVELQMFSKVPHLMLPVVTDMKQAANVLLWAVEKMEGRYEVLSNAGVKNIKTYNALGEEKLKERMGDNWNEERTPRHMPYIMVVIDEMADLMMTSKKEAEMAITRLAQKSRAVGIHVIVATQRPSTDVITGVLKGNLPTRIAFQVASKIDSRVILDTSGAEKLLGQGDMLYTPPQSSQVLRAQGALVEDHELQALVDFVCQESAPTFSQELIQAATGTAQPGSDSAAGGGGGGDDLWDEAVRIVLKSKRGSASLLQRALGIGYTRASRLIDIMTQEGIVGEYKGSKAREVMMSLEDWEEMYGAPAGSGD